MLKFGAIVLPLVSLLMLDILGHCEMSIYPGLRRKPLHQTLQQNFDVSSDFLNQLMEENARRRLQQQFEQQLALINIQMNRQRERFRQQQLQAALGMNEVDEEEDDENGDIDDEDQYDNSNPEFSYKYPSFPGNTLRERIPFAVGPSDPRYYELENRVIPDEGDADALDSKALDEYEEYEPSESKYDAIEQIALSLPKETDSNEVKAAGDSKADARPILAKVPPVEQSKALEYVASSTTFHRIKPQNAAAAAAVAGVNVAVQMKPTTAPNVVSTPAYMANTRHDINALIDKLQKQGKSGAIINGHEGATAAAAVSPLGHDQHMVVRQHLGIDSDMGMYFVALIAGVSAAVTVGLIALGIAWLHNKKKAAADIEYPAYGVTGPNKEISPSGDRKLAQCAQMYHYQQQKQKIISFENQQAMEGHCGLSDVESDDDNDEGDYTVYECPGLAPTAEMEVKNPLFLDETPVTPSSSATAVVAPISNIVKVTPQQPQVTRKTSGKPSAASSATSMSVEPSDEKKKKNKK